MLTSRWAAVCVGTKLLLSQPCVTVPGSTGRCVWLSGGGGGGGGSGGVLLFAAAAGETTGSANAILTTVESATMSIISKVAVTAKVRTRRLLSDNCDHL